MHSAPSVSYPVGRSVVLAGLLAAAAALGMVAVFAGVAYLSWAGAATAGLAWCGWVASSLWAWGRQPHGQLSWRAGTWSWVSEAYREGVGLLRVERVYDLQGAILLRLHNADGARTWVWVERRGDPARWHDLRRALIAHA
jgi:hypothetical protein